MCFKLFVYWFMYLIHEEMYFLMIKRKNPWYIDMRKTYIIPYIYISILNEIMLIENVSLY